MIPKPLEDNLKKAIQQREKWRSRKETCIRNLRKIQKRIELLEFQQALQSQIELPSRTISMPGGIDWGIYWRDTPLSTLPLSKTKGVGMAKAKHLIESFVNVGGLESWRVSRGFTSIPGFNRFAATNLEGMLLRWLKTYAPEYQIPAAADSLPVAQSRQKSSDGTLWLFPE